MLLASGNSAHNPLRFAGQYYDAEVGKGDNFARTYDYNLGRYVLREPFGIVNGINEYFYANSNPTKFIDPLGLEAVPRSPKPGVYPRCFDWPEYGNSCDPGCWDYCSGEQVNLRRKCIAECRPWWAILWAHAPTVVACGQAAYIWAINCAENCTGGCRACNNLSNSGDYS